MINIILFVLFAFIALIVLAINITKQQKPNNSMNLSIYISFILSALTWVMIIYDIYDRWYLISSEIYFVLEIFIYIFAVISVIFGISWAVKNKAFKSNKFYFLCALTVLAVVITCSHCADTIKFYIDYKVNYNNRVTVANKVLENYQSELESGQYPGSNVDISDLHSGLSYNDNVCIRHENGYIEVDFEIYDGSGHQYIDNFKYGKSGHLLFLKKDTGNSDSYTISKIIYKKNIDKDWLYEIEKNS